MTNEHPKLPPLTLLEEFLLLALDDSTGQLYPLAPLALDCATAGAILMDLTLRNRIDNDLRDLFTVDATPTGDAILDPVLQVMGLAPVLTPHPIAYWLRYLADEAEAFREKAFHRLEARGIIRRQNRLIAWVFGKRQYPLIDEKETKEIRARILGVVLNEDIPAPHDVMMTALAKACGLFPYLLDDPAASAKRIDQVAKLDLIGQAVAQSVNDVQSSIAMAAGLR